MKTRSIYTVTALHVVNKTWKHRGKEIKNKHCSTKRCFGFLETEAGAREQIAKGAHMVECLYTHLVLEEYPPGLYPHPKELGWFKWNQSKGAWLPCKKPRFAASIVNWAI